MSAPAGHLRGAFPLDDAPRLPLTGEAHPLRREFARWMAWASLAALVFGIVVFSVWTVLSRAKKAPPGMRTVKIVRYTELGVPPSIATPSVPQISIAQAVAPPSIGVPEPVPEVQAQTPTIATQQEISDVLTSTSMQDLGGGGTGDSLAVGVDIDTAATHPAPTDFVAVEQEPVRIRIDPPVYPDMAQQAGIEGTVTVQALVDKKGKVIDVNVIDGDPLLRDAAVVCAKTAVFRPALMQNEPVEVWVLMPITFKLNK